MVGMNLMLLSPHSLCSATDVMVNNGIATRGGKKGTEVTVPGLTMCRANHTNTSFLYESLYSNISTTVISVGKLTAEML